jgi:hypothetical protein
METKEIAMSKRTRIMGTAGVIAMALASAPAAADSLTDFTGNLVTAYTNTDPSGGGPNLNGWSLGGTLGGPLSDLAGLNFEVYGAYQHNWESHFSQEVWNFGGSAFWAGEVGRVGVNGNYTNYNDLGHFTSGGVLGEYYFGNFTGMAKGGWVSAGGAAFGGHGNYWGVGVTGYVMPDFSLTGGFDWINRVTGFGCQTCGRVGELTTSYSIIAEFLVAEDIGISGFGGYTYQHFSSGGVKDHDNVWLVGLRWYTGTGTLIDHHRNGNLNPWLSGP